MFVLKYVAKNKKGNQNRKGQEMLSRLNHEVSRNSNSGSSLNRGIF